MGEDFLNALDELKNKLNEWINIHTNVTNSCPESPHLSSSVDGISSSEKR